MNVTLSKNIAAGRHLKSVRDGDLAAHIGGYTEFIALIGYTRQQADRLVQLAERLTQ